MKKLLCVRGETAFRQAFFLQRAAPKWVEARVVQKESVVYVHGGYLKNFVRLSRDSMLLQVKVLIDLCCIDYPYREQRFSLVYMLCSVHNNIAQRQPCTRPSTTQRRTD